MGVPENAATLRLQQGEGFSHTRKKNYILTNLLPNIFGVWYGKR
jgi:hypothetical protein